MYMYISFSKICISLAGEKKKKGGKKRDTETRVNILDARTDDKMAGRKLRTRYVDARVNSIRNTTVRFNVYAKTKETRRVTAF